MIFPEGQREYSDGELLPFKEGVVQLAKKTGVPILPVTITGANLVWPREYMIPRLGKVRIYFHPLMFVDSTPKSGKGEPSINEIRLTLENKIRDPM